MRCNTRIFSISLLLVLLVLALSSLGLSQQMCTTSAAGGICGPYLDTQITGSNGNNTQIQNDVWNPIAGWQQTLYATNPGNWYVTANIPPYTGVVSYPDTDQLYSNSSTDALSTYSYMYSSFAENSDHSSNTVADNGYDIWLNGYKREVMIQHDIINRNPCTQYMTVLATNIPFGGSYGVPVNYWNLCRNGGKTGELVWQIVGPAGATTFGFTSGSVDILAMLNWLVNNGYLPSTSYFTAVQYGFEIGSTNGLNENFAVTSFTLTASHP